jgi:hypothetical protein
LNGPEEAVPRSSHFLERTKQAMIRQAILFSVLIAALSMAPLVCGDVVPIDPFLGSLAEDFGDFSQGARQEAIIFGGFGTVRNLTPGGSLKVEYYSSLSGRVVVPHSRPLMMGQLGISEWEFNEPLSQFGSYFANNSRFDDAQVDFYDENGDWIDSVVATVPNSGEWTWNGWESDVPIKSIVITGNDVEFFNGFIWFDDVQGNCSSAFELSTPKVACVAR